MSDETPDRVRSLQSLRTILEGLILAGVCWLASSTNEQGKATIKMQAEMTGMTEEMRALRAQLADVPAISRSLAKLEVRLDEHERRISQLEAYQRH